MKLYCTIHKVINMENDQVDDNEKSEMWTASFWFLFVGISFCVGLKLWVQGHDNGSCHTPGTQSLQQPNDN